MTQTIDNLGKKSRRAISTVYDTGLGENLDVTVETVYDPATRTLRSTVGGVFLNAEPLDKFTVKDARAEHKWIVENLDLLVIGSGHQPHREVEELRDLLAYARVRARPVSADRSNLRKNA